MTRRSRSNDGTPNTVFSLLPIRPELLNSLTSEFAERRRTVENKVAIYNGPRKGNKGAIKYSDEDVLTIRRLRSWLGMSVPAIALALGVSTNTVESYVYGANRLHLEPGPRPKEIEALLSLTNRQSDT